jgi:DNA-binding NtrC family response regulator
VALESVLIAEPDVHLSSFLVSALRAETTRVARSYEELFRELDERGSSLDLAVVSTDMDGTGPLEGFRRLRERCPELPVAWIAGDSTACEALDAKILDDPLAILLPKPFGVARLTEAIHDMMQSR